MKASAYTEQVPQTEVQPVDAMNVTDGMVGQPTQEIRPNSTSSSNESEKLVLTSKVNRRKANLGRSVKKQQSSPPRGKSDLVPENIPR